MIPFTPSWQETGRIGRMARFSGRMIRGEGAGAQPLKSTLCGVSGVIGSIGRMFATYAYARVNQGFGVWKFFLTRSLKISSLSSLSSLKWCQDIEKAGKSGCAVALIILPVLRAILPILPDQITRLADLVAGNENTTRYGKGAV